MCRIVGIYGSVEQSNLLQIGNTMRDCLAYGGPDDAGNFCDGDIYLGHRRLSIIDTSNGGHQPMIFKDWVIVFNGEIYNYRSIAVELIKEGYEFNSGSDTEVVLKAFDCWGTDAVQKFRGMFAFALWNTQSQKLLICRDRVGVKPLYWYKKNDVFLFASELKAFHEFPYFDAAIDQQAVSLYLQSGYIRSPYSIYKFAKKIKPGHFLEVEKDGAIKEWPYWDVNSIKVNTTEKTGSVLIEEAEAILTESCKLRMVADVPVGVFLSGGIDSSLVTALLQKDNPEKLKTFTIGFDSAGFDESVHAKKIAAYLGTDHYEYTCTERDFLEVIPRLADMYDEPFGDSSGIPTHLVAAMARKQVTVALSADGGDEVFAGYTRYQLVYSYYKKLRSVPLFVRQLASYFILKIPVVIWKIILPLLGKRNLLYSLEWRLPKIANVLKASSAIDMYERGFVNIPHQLLRKLHLFDENVSIFAGTKLDFSEDKGILSLLGKTDILSYLEGDILTKVDRASMQVALEGREPLLDHKLIEFGLSLSDEFKYQHGDTKWILKKVLEQYIPSELWKRPKQGFGIPVKHWLTDFLQGDLRALSVDETFLTRFKLNGSFLQQIVDQFLDKKRMNINPYFMWSIFMLYKWHKRWS